MKSIKLYVVHKALIMEVKGDWINYVKAPILRLQYQFRDRKLKGMDMAFIGNIPIAAGLSSSSAIVDEAVEDLVTRLEKAYYIPRGLKSDITPCVLVKGSGVLEV